MKDKILDIISDLIFYNEWTGACYASVAIAHTLLKFNKIESIPCIGVVGCDNGEFFDHAWLEIDGLIYDLAMPFPQDPRSRAYDYFDDRFGFRGIVSHPHIAFGIDEDLDDEAISIASDFGYLMKHTPCFNPEIDFWMLASDLSKKLNAPASVDDLKNSTTSSSWVIRRSQKSK
ncbi:hypothetical protein OOT00_15600 [Desulfobotulus sp. H1]|uniref:Microcin J25-processing protein McjB C-terminal domain-containing protein n=1 Tax=Desulfobotulus pelophilus TaxID=2823377 RepID=A0ABT3ND63_9BACT|nr:hypothetical protein [Desulfobotulus pelophilus]MCW7755406.1 hypothetical protein [Desulfobotulus pelophilus]